jgi:aminoglycoside phosphotransferase (APT) family kinase protein
VPLALRRQEFIAVHQLNDAEVAKRLLDHLARGFGCPDAVYIAGPVRIQGGFDAAIFGFTLDHVPPPLTGPLILRLCRPGTDPGRIKLETVVQNTLVEMGFPAPRVMVTESDPGVLGGPFMVMTRLSGQTLAHGIEGGFGAGTSLVRKMQVLFNLPAILGGITDQWVDMQIRLHQLPAETLLRAVTAAGIDAGAITFEGQLARLRTIVEQCDLIGLKPGLAWLDDHRPAKAREAAICHGDFHPLNILADNQPTGVIDWSNAVIAEAAMDVGSAIANMSAVPLPLPWALRGAAHGVIGAALRRYERTYRALRPLDDRSVLYYQVFRAVAQLVGVGQARATGRGGGGAFHSAVGMNNLIALIRKLSGVSARLEERVRPPGTK